MEGASSMLRLLLGVGLIVLGPALQAQGENPSGAGGKPKSSSSARRAEQPQNSAEAAPADPLSYYRQNPELMKRYFPQLASAEASAARKPSAPGELAELAPTPVLPVLKFGGGNAEQFVDELKKAIEPPPNIMIAPEMDRFQVPPFELHNVSLADIFQALNSLSDDKTVQWQLSGSTEPIWILNRMAVSTAPGPGFHQTYGIGRY